MKKLIFLGLAVIGFAMTSCKKTYTCSCDVNGSTTSQEYTVNSSDAETLQQSCESSSYCTWSAN